GAEFVVVSETGTAIRNFQLRCRHGVVFIDDWDHTHIEKRRQGVTKIQIAVPAGKVFFCEENLRRRQPVFGKALFVKIHQTALSDSGQGLFLYERSIRCAYLQRVSPKCNSSRGYDDNLASGKPGGSHLVDKRENPIASDIPGVV